MTISVSRLIILTTTLFASAWAAFPATESTTSVLEVDKVATDRLTSNPLDSFDLQPEALKRLGTSSGKTVTTRSLSARSPLLSGTVVLATWKGGQLTNQELSATVAVRRVGSREAGTPENYLSQPPEQLRSLVRNFAFEKIASQRAREEGISEETSGIKERIAQFRSDALNKAFFDREVHPMLEEAGYDMARRKYDQEKDRLFTTPERIRLREIFFSRYKTYTVKEGDTIESIARKQSGDVQAVLNILRTDAFHYPRLSPSAAKGEVPFVDVKPGEKLMVPLTRDEQTSKAALAAKVRDEATSKTFIALAQKYSENPQTTKTEAFIPDLDVLDPRVKEAVAGKEPGTISRMVETPNGWSVFLVDDREPSRTLTFEEVRAKGLMKFNVEDRRLNEQKTLEEFSRKLEKKHNLTIHEDILRRPDDQGKDPLTANTVIASAPGFTYTLEEFRRDLVPTMKSWSGLTFEQRLLYARSSQAVARYLVSKEAESMDLDKTPEVRAQIEDKIVSELSQEYVQRKFERKMPTDQQLREYYTAHIDRFTSPARVALREITKRVSLSLPDAERTAAIEEAKQELGKIRKGITSLAEFEQAARGKSEALSTRSHGGYIGTVPVSFRGEMFRNQIENLKPGQISEPFLYGSEVMIIRVDESYPSAPMAFEEVLPRVRTEYLREVPQKRFEEFKDQLLREAGFELKI